METTNTKPSGINTGLILNIGLLIAAGLVGRKLLQTFGVLKTAEEQKNIEQSGAIITGSELTPTKPDASNPALAFNPKYNTVLIADYNKKNNITTNVGFVATRQKFMPVDKTKPTGWPSQLITVAKEIYNSKGLFNDDEQMLFNSFNKLRNQAQVSYIAEIFQKDKRDLTTFLKSFLNDEEMAKLYRIVANKPLLL
tara:strand:- start:6406 stop:6993 length:588 start_codon:yes stop_codon:yes gene_type:complete